MKLAPNFLLLAFSWKAVAGLDNKETSHLRHSESLARQSSNGDAQADRVLAVNSTIPLDLVFAIDESGSMSSAQDGVRTQVAYIFAQLAATLGSTPFRVGLVGFGADDNGGNPILRHVLTRDQATFQVAVDNLEVSGGYEPGYIAAQEIAANSVGGQALNTDPSYADPFPGPGYCIVLISDEDANGAGTLEETVQALNNTNGAFFAITNGQTDYTDLAAATGGTSHDLYDFIADSTPVLTSILTNCLETIVVEKCGDGVLDPLEECDDGNTVDGDGCSSTCRITCDPATDFCCGKADGTKCNMGDGNKCLKNSQCMANKCEPGPLKVCRAPTKCKEVVGGCDTATGFCTFVNKPDGTKCSDGKATTKNDKCKGGFCVGTPI